MHMRKTVIAIPAMCDLFMPATVPQKKTTGKIPNGHARLTPETSIIIERSSARTGTDGREDFRDTNTGATLRHQA